MKIWSHARHAFHSRHTQCLTVANGRNSLDIYMPFGFCFGGSEFPSPILRVLDAVLVLEEYDIHARSILHRAASSTFVTASSGNNNATQIKCSTPLQTLAVPCIYYMYYSISAIEWADLTTCWISVIARCQKFIKFYFILIFFFSMDVSLNKSTIYLIGSKFINISIKNKKKNNVPISRRP